MQCKHCGGKLDKTDIFCIRCKTPVLTEDDDVTSMLHTNIARLTTNTPQSDDAELTDANTFSGDAPNSDDTTLADTTLSTDTAPYRKSDTSTDAVPNSDTVRFTNTSPSADATPQNTDAAQSANEPTKKSKLPEFYDPPKKKNSRAAVIITTILVCVTLMGIGLYFLIRPSVPQQDTTSSVIQVDTDDDPEQGDSDTDTDPIRTQPQAVTSIMLSSGGRAQTEFHTRVNETILLQAQLEPEGVYANITWESSDPDVLDVVPFDSSGQVANITGKAAGVADIIVTAGGIEMAFVVFVDDLPMHVQLENAVENGNESIWLTMRWIGGQRSGQEVLYERTVDSHQWTMEDASGISVVEPTFAMEDNAYTISFPTTTRVFYLFADGTGHFRNPDGSENEDLTWEFMTIRIHPEG